MRANDHDVNPMPPGLPARLPKGEELLWQGKPDWRRLAIDAFALKWISVWVALAFLWRMVLLTESQSLALAAFGASPILALGILGIGILALMGYFQARGTYYTITSRRVVMKIGAALSITLNIPFQHIDNAGLSVNRDGIGNIALQTKRDQFRLSYLMLWPHVRPWHMRLAEPCLRAIPDAARVAGILAEAAETELARPKISTEAPARPLTAGPVAAE